MTKDIYVQAQADHIASLSAASPVSALEELVWNSLDADAREVRIDVITNPLGGVEGVRISDDGTGINILRVESTFGSLGGSWKRIEGAKTRSSRALHGRKGRGRFKAFAIGSHVEWRTTMRAGEELLSYTLSGDASEPGVFHIEQAAQPGPATGTEVYISCIRVSADSLCDAEQTVQALASKFALYLKSYPNVSIYFCGIPVTPVIVQKAARTIQLPVRSNMPAKLEIIEWRRKAPGAGKLVFCGRDGFALYEIPSGVRPGAAFSYTAYLVSDRFSELNGENALVMEELHPEVHAYIEEARGCLRDYFKERSADAEMSRVASWIEETSYPFDRDDTSALRRKFDESVKDMRSRLDGFDSMSAAERAYLFNLLKRVCESESAKSTE